VHAVATLLVAEHLQDLLREAERERQHALIRGARRSAWSATSSGRLAGLLRRLTGSGRRGSNAARPNGARPATA
jgi:hypothetical protein